jgi:hypothetical protein
MSSSTTGPVLVGTKHSTTVARVSRIFIVRYSDQPDSLRLHASGGPRARIRESDSFPPGGAERGPFAIPRSAPRMPSNQMSQRGACTLLGGPFLCMQTEGFAIPLLAPILAHVRMSGCQRKLRGSLEAFLKDSLALPWSSRKLRFDMNTHSPRFHEAYRPPAMCERSV